jgi:hypothetical protein
MTERRVRGVSRPRVASYAGPSVRVARHEKQPHNGFIFGRPEALSPGIPRDTFGSSTATHSGVACPPNSDAKQRGLLLALPRMPTDATDASKPPRRTACGWLFRVCGPDL